VRLVPLPLRLAVPSLARFAAPYRYVRRDLWRNKAIEIRAQFERNRNVRDPRAVAALLNEAEKEVHKFSHPDPYRRASPLSSCSVFETRCAS